MIFSYSLPEFLFLACIIGSIIGGIGVFLWIPPLVRARWHAGISGGVFVLTSAAFLWPIEYHPSIWWNNDALASLSRFLIAFGGVVSTFLLKNYYPKALIVSRQEKQSCLMLSFYHWIIAIAILEVSLKDIFMALFCMILIAMLFFYALVAVTGERNLKIGWLFFCYYLILVMLIFIGKLLTMETVLESTPALQQLSSLLLNLGLGIGVGVFPMPFVLLKLNKELPIVLKTIGSFVLSLPFISILLQVQIIKIYAIHGVVQDILFALALLTIGILLVLEKKNQTEFLRWVPYLLSALCLIAVVLSREEGIYSAGLLMIALVILGPLSTIITHHTNTNSLSLLNNWMRLASSGLFPFGIFVPLLFLMICLMTYKPQIGWVLLVMITLRGYRLFQVKNIQLIAKDKIDRSFWIVTGLLVIQTFILPYCLSNWLHMMSHQLILPL